MKLKSIFLHTILGLSALAALAFFVPETATLENSLPIKEAKAEEACPASIPESYSTIRTGSANGPIIASYTNYGWNAESGVANPSYETLSVPLGTVLYYSNSTSGITGPNRSIGSTHSAPGGATVTSPGDKAGYYPSGYYFTRQTFVSGYTSPVTASGTFLFVGGYFSCWGGYDDGITELFIQIVAQGEPVPTTKTFNSTLAIVKDPSVALLVNTNTAQTTGGLSSASITTGSSVNLNWTTDSVNQGNSCTASNLHGDTNWSGPKLGQTAYTPPASPPASGGSQTMGPFNTPGTFQYTIQCGGLNNVQSTPSTVTITVGSPASISCGPIQTVVQGGTATYAISGNGLTSSTNVTMSSSPVTNPAPTLSGSPLVLNSGNGYSNVASVTTVGVASGTYTLTFTGTPGTLSCTSTLQITPYVPIVTIQFNNQSGTVSIGTATSGTISWSNQNVDTCTATTVSSPTAGLNVTPAWSGTITPAGSGSLAVSGIQSGETYTFFLNCTGPGGSDSDSVQVSTSFPAPAVNITCYDGRAYNDGPCDLVYGTSTTLRWTSSNITSGTCTLTANGTSLGAVADAVSLPPYNTGNLYTTTTYVLTCSGPGTPSPASDSVVVNVPPIQAPVVDIKCADSIENVPADGCSVQYGTQAYLFWTTESADECFLDWPGGADEPGVQGTTGYPTGALTTSRTYTLTCNGPGGTGVDTATVSVGADFTLSCTPATITLTQGDSSSYSLATTALGGFSDRVSFTGPSVNPDPLNPPTFSFIDNDQRPSAVTTALVETTPYTTSGTYILTFTAEGGSVTKTCDVELVVSEPPLLVDIDCTDATSGPTDGPCSVAYNGSATLSWTSTNCTSVSIDQGIGAVAASGSISTGALTATKTYLITCVSPTDTKNDSVVVAVGSDWSCASSPPTITITAGDVTSFNLATTGMGGFSSAVTFDRSSFSPRRTTEPSVTYSGNGQVPAANTTAIITTTTSTSAGSYTVTFSGTGNGISHSCPDVELIVNPYIPPAPSVDIECTDSTSGPKDGPCSVNYNGSATLSWSSANCTSVSIDQGIGTVAASGSTSTGALTTTKTYTITCVGASSNATDTVTVAVGSDWTLACSPATIAIEQGNTDSYNLSTTGLGGFPYAVTFSTPTYNPTPGTAPSVSFSNNGQVPSAITVAIITTTESVSTGTYTLTFSGTGNGVTRTCDVELVITAATPVNPNQPVVTTDNSTCGLISVSWTLEVPPSPTGFRVFYSSSNTGPWTDISGLLLSSANTFDHTSDNPINPPASSNNYYQVRAYNGAAYNDSKTSGPVGLLDCVSNISSSDKDLTQVVGQISKTFSPTECSGVSEVAELPNNALFSPGDVVTFKINICNSGSAPLTGVTLTDYLSNLSSPSAATSNPVSCLTGQSYDEKTNTMAFSVQDIPASSGSTQLCSIEFTAVVTTPPSATGTINRFRNSALIYANEILSDPVTYPLGYYEVATPPYLFGATENIPGREETAPQ